MKSLLIAVVLALMGSSGVMAQERAKQTEVKRVPAHTPEWTDLNSGDPGTTDSAVPELASIVVLCATKPDSKEFKKAWRSWLDSNYQRGKKNSTKISKSMHDTAKAMISNVR